MRAFLEIDYTMSINKLPTTKSYWGCGQFIVVHFSDNTKDDKSDNGYKVDPLSTILTRILVILFQIMIPKEMKSTW